MYKSSDDSVRKAKTEQRNYLMSAKSSNIVPQPQLKVKEVSTDDNSLIDPENRPMTALSKITK